MNMILIASCPTVASATSSAVEASTLTILAVSILRRFFGRMSSSLTEPDENSPDSVVPARIIMYINISPADMAMH